MEKGHAPEAEVWLPDGTGEVDDDAQVLGDIHQGAFALRVTGGPISERLRVFSP